MKLKKMKKPITLKFVFHVSILIHTCQIFSNSPPFLKRKDKNRLTLFNAFLKFRLMHAQLALPREMPLNVGEDYSRCEIFVDRFKIHFIHSKRRASGK